MGRVQTENIGVNYRCSPDNRTSDLDFTFTTHSSTTSNFTTSTSTSTSTSAHSSPTVSFNHRLSPIITNLHRPHRHHDPHWSAIRSATNNSPDGTLHLHHLKLIRQLGAGDLGRVFLCRIRDDHTSSSQFALKVIDRNLLTPSKHAHLETEAKILAHLDHPFLPTLYARIDASHYTCFLIDYCSGGDLNTLIQRIHRRRGRRLPLSAVRFYAAEVLVAIEYLHSKGIVYRDLKPENILIREDGHIMVSDFDLCFTSEVTARIERQQSNLTRSGDKNKKKNKNYNEMEVVAEPVSAYSRSCVGTHEYLAPELVYGKGHGNGVDWWAFGVLIYEMMYGTTPFKGMDKEETVRNIAMRKEGVEFPSEVSGEEEMVFRDLIGRLLVKNPSMRLGCERGAAEIKRHLFFSGVNWALIREYTPPGMVVSGNDGCLIVRKRSGGGAGRSGGGISGKGHGLGQLSPRRRMKWGWRRLRNLLKDRRV